MDMRNNSYELGTFPFIREIKGIKDKWLWFLSLGILLIILGAIVVNHAFFATVFSVFLLGVILFGGGVIQIVESFWASKWSGVFLSLLVGILYLVAGYLFVARPAGAATAITLLIAFLLIIGGLFRIIVSAWYQFEHWGWVFFNGIISTILGALIYAGWPTSGLWVIGLFLGIDMIMSGITWIMVALSARKLKNEIDRI